MAKSINDIPRLGWKSGFTLIELLVVISIISLLSTVALTSVNAARIKARDTKRMADKEQIVNALELYRNSVGHYPYNTDNDASGWDYGYSGGLASGDIFIQPLVDTGLFSPTPGDPTNTAIAGGYRYYRYPEGYWGRCDPALGALYIFQITFESSDFQSKVPVFSCPAGTDGTNTWTGTSLRAWGNFEY